MNNINNNWSTQPGQDNSRRRSQRVMLSLPVTISGKSIQGSFSESGHTMVINAHGALVNFKAKAAKGQTLRLKSATYPDEVDCQVIWVGPTADGKTQYGLEFIKPAPRFWGVSFPPADWSPAATGVLAESSKKK
jgi:PilZ domain